MLVAAPIPPEYDDDHGNNGGVIVWVLLALVIGFAGMVAMLWAF